jgi:RNA recognition motif-containing protein
MTGQREREREDFGLRKKLYVGNMPYSMTEGDLKDLFEEYGAIASVAVITDRATGRPRGFGFVEFEDENSADAAQRALDGREIMGRPLRVNEANERPGRTGPGFRRA